MPAYDSATLAALEEGRVIKRDLLYVFGKDSNGDNAEFGFWEGEDNITETVVGARDGVNDSRSYVGGGTVVSMPPFPFEAGLVERQIDVVLSGVHSAVLDMVFGNDIRGVRAEVHRAFFDKDDGGLTGTPKAQWSGFVLRAEERVGGAGGAAEISLMLVNSAWMLSQTNSSLRSNPDQKDRASGDLFYKYAGRERQINRVWGQKRGKKGKRK